MQTMVEQNKVNSAIAPYKAVLIIDDDDVDTFINQKILANANFSANTYAKNSVTTALSLLRSMPEADLPDLILLDINMPILNGFDFLNAFNTLHHTITSRCRIVVLSSSMHDEEIRSITSNKYVEGFVNKPLDLNKLQTILDKNVERTA